jgi:hypothetical protein
VGFKYAVFHSGLYYYVGWVEERNPTLISQLFIPIVQKLLVQMRLVQRNDPLNPVIRNAVRKLKNDRNIMLITLSSGMLLQVLDDSLK